MQLVLILLVVIFYCAAKTAAVAPANLPFAANVSTYAGDCLVPGMGNGKATDANFAGIADVVSDGNGNLYVADAVNNLIRTVMANGTVMTLAGGYWAGGLSPAGGYEDGIGSMAQFSSLSSMAINAGGIIYLTDAHNISNNSRIRKITTPGGKVTTFAGNANFSFANGMGTSAGFYDARGVAFDDTTGTIIVIDTGNNCIRAITSSGLVTTLAGSTNQSAGYADGKGIDALFARPQDGAFDDMGNLFVCDTDNRRIRKVTPVGVVTTFAGSGIKGHVDGPPEVARFNMMSGIDIDKMTGILYVTDLASFCIRFVLPNGYVSTLAGNPTNPGTANGVGTAASFKRLTSITLEGKSGDLFVGDQDCIRRIALSCPAGYFCPDATLTICPVGTFSLGGASTAECTPCGCPTACAAGSTADTEFCGASVTMFRGAGELILHPGNNYIAPNSVGCTVTVTMQGAAGGNAQAFLGGNGANFDVHFDLAAGETFQVATGRGGTGTTSGPTIQARSAGGGSATALFLGGVGGLRDTTLAVAGGGGGAAYLFGGGDAGLPGGDGEDGAGDVDSAGGRGGSQEASGATGSPQLTRPNLVAGNVGSGFEGGSGGHASGAACLAGGVNVWYGAGGCGYTYATSVCSGGGGGSGWYGGGGGIGAYCLTQAGGGGGSSFVNADLGVTSTGGLPDGRSAVPAENGTAGSVVLLSCMEMSASPTPSPTMSASPTPSPTPTPSSTFGTSPSPTPTQTQTQTQTPTPTKSRLLIGSPLGIIEAKAGALSPSRVIVFAICASIVAAAVLLICLKRWYEKDRPPLSKLVNRPKVSPWKAATAKAERSLMAKKEVKSTSNPLNAKLTLAPPPKSIAPLEHVRVESPEEQVERQSQEQVVAAPIVLPNLASNLPAVVEAEHD